MNYGQTRRQKPEQSVLETYIKRACDPSRHEPDLALNMEICDVIKEKQKNTPREAAIYIVRLVNDKNMHVGMLALALLDNCVKNCGHPFHLQIATKEFLNSLVRKFPERPLTTPTPIQTRVLELIQEWYTTLCKTSRYKDDLVHIRDMHRLLAFKGYRFPQANRTATLLYPVDVRDEEVSNKLYGGDAFVVGFKFSILNGIRSLKSPAELEEEDRVAQAAQLQELIRRGRPEDVRAANELVKRMTGYEHNKPKYSEQTSAVLDRLRQKATLLMEMLNDVKPGEIIGRGDIFEDLFGTCKAAHPRIQKFITENEDPDNMDKLTELNEILNNVVEQYQQVKNGNLVRLAVPESSEDGGGQTNMSQDASTSRQTQSSLIDLLDFDGSSTSAAAPGATGNLMDDLMNLSFNETPPPLSWGASGSISLGQSNNITSELVSPSSPTNGGAPNYNVFASPIASVNPVLVGSIPRSSPSIPVLPQKPGQSSAVSPLDGFEFVSNTGISTQILNVLVLNKNGFQIDLDIEKQSSPDRVYKIKAYFSNQQNSPLTSLTFRVAVPKTLKLKLDPQSAQVVPPFSQKTVTQELTIGVPVDVASVRMRYQVSYNLAGKKVEEQGEFNQFP
ncbi:hypothetical protein BGZ65_006402 [Modicella reniformis]|uniref:Uncharacterized protein n=1 Tax=Modicella reniformis TaxID=1440133 RepID=A0A9P6M2K9_9FUNG|nr:hypothetical protein BGZ65_006402 [Modicella reniformis]